MHTYVSVFTRMCLSSGLQKCGCFDVALPAEPIWNPKINPSKRKIFQTSISGAWKDLSFDSHHMFYSNPMSWPQNLAPKPPIMTAIPGELHLCLLFFGRTFDSNLFSNLVAFHHRQLEQICHMAALTEKKREAFVETRWWFPTSSLTSYLGRCSKLTNKKLIDMLLTGFEPQAIDDVSLNLQDTSIANIKGSRSAIPKDFLLVVLSVVDTFVLEHVSNNSGSVYFWGERPRQIIKNPSKVSACHKDFQIAENVYLNPGDDVFFLLDVPQLSTM